MIARTGRVTCCGKSTYSGPRGRRHSIRHSPFFAPRPLTPTTGRMPLLRGTGRVGSTGAVASGGLAWPLPLSLWRTMTRLRVKTADRPVGVPELGSRKLSTAGPSPQTANRSQTRTAAPDTDPASRAGPPTGAAATCFNREMNGMGGVEERGGLKRLCQITC